MRRLAAMAIAAAVIGGLLVTWLLYPAPLIPRSVEVPALRGVPAAQAVANLAGLGLRGRVAAEIADPLVPDGAVSWQSPAPYTVLPESTIVELGISVGQPTVMVPDLIDLDLGTAKRVLDAAGLMTGEIDSAWSRQPLGAVILTRPEARSGRRAGGTVDVTISKGSQGRVQ
jgi:beta-lactam-binding protein with PASTA domain